MHRPGQYCERSIALFLSGFIADIWIMAYPLIITLELETKIKEHFTNLRKIHFPKHSNYLDAHLTLFHRLPSDISVIAETLKELAVRPVLCLEVNAVISLGNGVAFTLVSHELQQMHLKMQEAFEPWLIRQDRKILRPHITIQNKVTAFKAKCLQEKLQASFRPYTIKATGFNTWHYLGGPRKAAMSYAFCGG